MVKNKMIEKAKMECFTFNFWRSVYILSLSCSQWNNSYGLSYAFRDREIKSTVYIATIQNNPTNEYEH